MANENNKQAFLKYLFKKKTAFTKKPVTLTDPISLSKVQASISTASNNRSKYTNVNADQRAMETLTVKFVGDKISDESIPVAFSYYNRKVENLLSWSDLYVKFMRIFWIEHNRYLKKYMGKSFVNQPTIDIGDLKTSKSMMAPKKIADNVFIETKFICRNIVKRIKAVLDIAGVPTKRLKIVYTQPKANQVLNTPDSHDHDNVIPNSVTTKIKNNNDFVNWIVKVSGLAPATAKSYYSSVNTSERIAKEQNLKSQRLLTAESYEEANETFNELMRCETFIKMNATAHNSLTAGVRKFLQFLQSNSAETTYTYTSDSQLLKDDAELVEMCRVVLADYFPNGIKKESVIAQKKFKTAFYEKYGDEFPQNKDMEQIIRGFAIEYSDKYYLVSSDAIEFIKQIIDSYVNNGQMVFFYSVLYAKYSVELTGFCIYADDMLKTILEDIYTEFTFKKIFFSPVNDMTLEKAIVSAYREDICLTLEEISERLPFVENNQILIIWSRDSRFVRVSDGKYALENQIVIDDNDVELSKEVLKNDIDAQGYSFLTRLIVENSENFNPEISDSALQTVLFDRKFADLYSRNRYLIAPYGKATSISTVLMNYCCEHSRITLSEIEAYESELTGNEDSRRSLRAAMSSMIRIDENTFVNVNEFKFDIIAVDEAISVFVNSNIISLDSISSFNSFPYIVGYAWNTFLLESYIIHFSRKWSFLGVDTKNRSVGAIYNKELELNSYDDAMAKAVADSDIELTQDEVCDYLLKNKYRMRKGDVSDIISKAYKIRLQEE